MLKITGRGFPIKSIKTFMFCGIEIIVVFNLNGTFIVLDKRN